jgi:hypothetical protein
MGEAEGIANNEIIVVNMRVIFSRILRNIYHCFQQIICSKKSSFKLCMRKIFFRRTSNLFGVVVVNRSTKMKIANHKKSKVVPKLSGLLLALTTAFLLAACGGGGSSAVGSDSNETVSTSTGSNSSSGSSSSSRGSDDDNCVPPSTPVVAKHGGMDDDDDLDTDDDDDDDDDDDKKCAAPLPPLTAADLAAGKLGKTLWATNCFSCHGSDTHEVRTAARILKAIDENKGGMGKLKGVITATDAANIAIYAARPSAF